MNVCPLLCLDDGGNPSLVSSECCDYNKISAHKNKQKLWDKVLNETSSIK